MALVIGNGAYVHAGVLRNPVPDARAVAAKLRGSRFEVTLLEEQRLGGMQAALGRFAEQADRAEVAVVKWSTCSGPVRSR